GVWSVVLSGAVLPSLVPVSVGVKNLSAPPSVADVIWGAGPVKGRSRAKVGLAALHPPRSATLSGTVVGALGSGGGNGRVTLTPDGDGGTIIAYTYEAALGGKVAAVGGRLLDGATRVIFKQFFAELARKAGG